MYLTLSQAAKKTGKSKGTISKYLKNGKLSYISKDDSGYQIDQSELLRVFPNCELKPPQNERLETSKNHEGNAFHEREIELLNSMIEELKADKAFLQEELKKSSALLPNMHHTRPPKAAQSFRWPWVGKHTPED